MGASPSSNGGSPSGSKKTPQRGVLVPQFNETASEAAFNREVRGRSSVRNSNSARRSDQRFGHHRYRSQRAGPSPLSGKPSGVQKASLKSKRLPGPAKMEALAELMGRLKVDGHEEAREASSVGKGEGRGKGKGKDVVKRDSVVDELAEAMEGMQVEMDTLESTLESAFWRQTRGASTSWGFDRL